MTCRDTMSQARVRHRDGQAGFTLLEILIVVAVIAFVLGILTLGVRRSSDAYQLRRAATLIMLELRRAQAMAMAEGVDFIVEFDVVTGSGTTTGVKLFRSGTATPVRTVSTSEWPSIVQIIDGPSNFPDCTAPGTDAANDCATFKPLGYPAQSGRVRLKVKAAASGQVEVSVEPATGRVSMIRL